MTGEAHWVTSLLFGAGGAALALLGLVYARLERRYRLAKRTFDCPVRHRLTEVTLVYDARSREWTGVHACFLRGPNGSCERACLG